MSKLLHKALDKLSHHEKDKDGHFHGSKVRSNSADTQSGASTPTAVDGIFTGDSRTSIESGTSTPHYGITDGALVDTPIGTPPRSASPVQGTSRISTEHQHQHVKIQDGATGESGVKRTSTANRVCDDIHSHFVAIKAIHGKKGSQSPKTSLDNGRPPLNHMVTEEDHRALKVDRQDQLHKEQLERELGYKRAYDGDPLNGFYGFLNIDATPNAVDTTARKNTFTEIAEMREGDHVYFRARIQSVRPQSSKLAFLIFRQRYQELQGVLSMRPNEISENMVRFAERLPAETIVLCHGIVQDPHSVGQKDIHYTSIHNVEVKIQTLHVVSQVTQAPPFNIHDAGRPESDFHQDDQHMMGNQVSARQHFNNRVASLRTPVNQAIFQIRAAICFYFRDYLTARGFTEIQSSKFQQGAPESGASVFKVDYFHRMACLAQSPQLAKQMCIAADMQRVFEIGPVFRAENSQTARHLTEFIGLDLEMELDVDYSELIDMLDGLMVYILQNLQKNQEHLIDVVRRQFNAPKLVIPDKTLRLTFKEAVKILNDSGWREDGELISEFEDFSTPTEKHLGKLIKEKYNTDFYIVNKFPASARPFYTMPDPNDPRISNSADFFLRGQEILSGGQRIHHAPLLEQKMKEAKLEPADMADYLDGFRWGCPPHGGGGFGLDRILFLALGLDNIRWASLLPRDPKSFPASEAPHGGKALRGPEINLLDWDVARRRGEVQDLPSIENLIASYGDAANTVLTDPGWEVWRDAQTGAAQGFKESEGYALCWGRPLCDDKQLRGVIERFVEHLKKTRKLKPIFACIDETTEQVLAKVFEWRSLAVAAEERIDPTTHNPNSNSSKSNLAKKIKQAKSAGVKAVVCDGLPNEDVRKAINQRMEDWRGTREGKQMHTTDLLPWDDSEHRRYFYAQDKHNQYVALVVLAQLAPVHGFQIKYSLSFPDGPSGSIELLLSTAIETMAAAGCHSATFGTSAATHLGEGSHQSALKMKTLSKAYDAITSTFHLLSKPEFRAKFGSEQDMVYLAYPKHGGLGVAGIHAIVKGLSEDGHKAEKKAAKHDAAKKEALEKAEKHHK